MKVRWPGFASTHATPISKFHVRTKAVSQPAAEKAPKHRSSIEIFNWLICSLKDLQRPKKNQPLILIFMRKVVDHITNLSHDSRNHYIEKRPSCLSTIVFFHFKWLLTCFLSWRLLPRCTLADNKFRVAERRKQIPRTLPYKFLLSLIQHCIH